MQTKMLELKDGKIAYDDSGSGPLVICAPSMGDLRAEYRFLIPLLVEAGYRVVSVDLRGHGDSSAAWADVSIEAIGSDLVALIRSLDAGPATIIGTSMSAATGVWAAAEAPELVNGLALIGPFVRDTQPLWKSRLMFTPLFARPWGPAVWMRYFTTLYPSRPPEDFASYCTVLRGKLSDPARLSALRRMMTSSKAGSEARLARVHTPVLVLMGSKDPDFPSPEAEARLVAERLHGSYHMIEGAGHYPHAEMPEITAPLLLAFLQGLKETRTTADAA